MFFGQLDLDGTVCFMFFLFVFMMTLADSQLPLQRFEGLVLERFADCIDGQVERFLAEIFV